MTYTKTFATHFDPVAEPEACVIRPGVRFTVLTSRLLRLEFSPNDTFEDRPSQTFWYRRQPIPDFQVMDTEGAVQVETGHLKLSYRPGPGGFNPEALQIRVKTKNATWNYGQQDPTNLRGTTRTLDNVDGKITLEEGLISRSGWAVYDDTSRLVFNDAGWLVKRNAPSEYQDLYFFGHGDDYYRALAEFSRLAGPAPLLPRWALGNWWSRYWAYSAEDLLALMDEFQTNRVPLSVCIVDMDWHITETGNASSGWTGYTWNRDLFPDPKQFIAELHARGLRTALNLHPATGIYPHEAQYPAMARHMGVDPDSREPIPFAIDDPHFAKGYFEILHHPHEADGIDFWWTDWQQGTHSGTQGLDPLWWLNHLHFYDLGRPDPHGGKAKRPFIFSRWGGLGNHRYPIGFSGDTVVSWETLQFQPYFTATAANVNYGWWSHDIGGHMGGVEDPELYTRWIQYGVFSPILRMHCTNNPFHERRPWGFDAEAQAITSRAMRLRHQLIPYLYAMSWRNHQDHIPLTRPMYYDHPDLEPAYHCPDQYYFGSELLAAPVVNPVENDTRHSRSAVWLPPGEWFGFFDGMRYPGGEWHPIYSRLDEIPVFARAGAIVPLGPETGWGGVENPESLEIQLFPGADNRFELFEDDGGEVSSLTTIRSQWSSEAWVAAIEPVAGPTGHLPATRAFVMDFRSMSKDAAVEVLINDEPGEHTAEFDEPTQTWTVTVTSFSPHDSLTVTLTPHSESLCAADIRVLSTCRKLVTAFRMDTWAKQRLFNQLPALIANPAALAYYVLDLTAGQMRALQEIITGAGCYRFPTRRTDHEAIVFWNNAKTDQVRYKLIAADLNNQSKILHEAVPNFGVLDLGPKIVSFHQGYEPAPGRTNVAEWLDTLTRRIRPELAQEIEAVIQFEAGEVRAFVTIETGEIALSEGSHINPDVTLSAATEDWLALINGEETPEEMFLADRLNITGNWELVNLLGDAIQVAPLSKFRAHRFSLELSYFDIPAVSLTNQEKNILDK